MRENMYAMEAEKLELELATRGVSFNGDERKRLEETRAKYQAKAETYKEEEEIMKGARTYEEERDLAARRDPYFDYAEVLLQIAIVLASVAMLSGRKAAFYVSILLALIGLALGVNGYGLFAKVPGLE